MDTSRMLYLTDVSAQNSLAMFMQIEQMRNAAVKLYDTMEALLYRSQIADIVNSYYDIGTVSEVYQIFGGYVNKSFGVYTVKDGKKCEYFVRKYKVGITEQEILFEHSFINCAIENGLDIAAAIIRTKEDGTFVKLSEEVNGKTIDRYFAIYTYLDGEDKYTWDNNNLNDEEYKSSAEVLAKLHYATRDFDPKGLERIEPKIMEFVPTLPPKYREFAKLDLPNNRFHQYYLANLEDILEVIERTVTLIPKEALAKMPMNPIHCDVHPGNFKYKDNQAVGVFDFDWAKIDLRLFDVCEALAYFCSSWEAETDGNLLIDKCGIFIKAYQEKLKELGGLPPLNETELQYLPDMLAIANIYLVNWDVTAYYADTSVNVFEYKAYLQHNVKLMRYIERHKEAIREMIKNL
ncbi:MAG: phosphotransferase [Bacillota bacterium]|nr:phosphotransferase [Bacillota bacterium]